MTDKTVSESHLGFFLMKQWCSMYLIKLTSMLGMHQTMLTRQSKFQASKFEVLIINAFSKLQRQIQSDYMMNNVLQPHLCM